MLLRRRFALVVLVSLCALVGVLAVGGGSAFALNERHLFSGSFGGEGSGNGQLTGPSGVAVDDATHDVYVVDAGDDRVEQFTSAGAYVAQFDGSAAPSGAFSSPSAVAVDNSGNVLDPSAGDVYVVDTGHSVIDKFSSAGTYLGQLSETAGGAVFAELDGVAVDANGVVWVYQGSGEIDSFSDALGNEYLAKVQSPFGSSPGFAVDSEDNLYVNRGAEVFAELDSAGAQLKVVVDNETSTAAAVDLSGNEVFIDNVGSVAAFTSAGSLIERFGDEQGVAHLSAGRGVAVDPGSGTVYVADSTADVVAVFGAVVVPDVTTGAASNVHASTVTLNGAVNPEGIQLSDCRFEYGSDTSYGQSAPCVPAAGSIPADSSEHAVSAVLTGLTPGGSYHFRLVASNANGTNTGQDQVANIGPGMHGESVVDVTSSGATLQASIDPRGVPTGYYFEYGTTTSYGSQVPATAASVGGGNGDVEVSQSVSGLQPDTVYHYRVVGVINGVEAFPGTDHTFTTLPKGPGMHGESVIEVGSSGATLQASLEPRGVPTSYYFQYGTTTGYGSQAPAAAASVGAGSDVEVSQRVSGLQPGTVYHYRVVGVQGSEAFPGTDHAFTTQTAGGASALIDGRSWEMVSPESKQQALIEPQGQSGLIQASEDGSAIVYTAHSPINADAIGHPAITQVLGRRGPGGWSAQELNPPDEDVVNLTLGNYGEAPYKLFSPDLSVGLLEPQGNTPLLPLPADAERTPYLHDFAANGNLPLVTPATANVLPGAKIGEESSGTELHFAGASSDLRHVVLASPEALTPQSVRAGEFNLYEWFGGQLKPVNVLPDGAPAGEVKAASFLGWTWFSGSTGVKRNAVSADGSRVVWQTNQSEHSGGDIYLRDMVRGETVQLDTVQGGEGAGEPVPGFQAASSDGSRVFFTDKQELTANATQGVGFQGDLYVFEVAGGGVPLSGTLRDLTVDQNPGESAEVLGAIPGASEDGSTVYFVANGALAPGAVHGDCEPVESDANACNLYVVHYDGAAWSSPKLIAVLSGADRWDMAGIATLIQETDKLSARVSPDGRYLAFMSDRSLTGYDNRDAVSGERDQEVYLYDSVTGRLSCASCDPTGARPTGIFDKQGLPLVDRLEVFQGGWLAGSVPGWAAATRGALLYQPRYLSDSGRLFFDSPVALVPGDVNGKEDAYELEPAGVGDCQTGTHTARVVFSMVAGGCVGLISSGTSGDESAFVDASASGGDVFFVTSAGLVPGDGDGSFDLYDAHECAGGPCPAAAAVASVPSCGSAEACRGGSSSPGVLGAPGSSSFVGGGNLAPVPAVVSKPKARGLSRAQKLARALKLCKRKPRARRAVCRARAHRAFGAGTSRAGKATARSGR